MFLLFAIILMGDNMEILIYSLTFILFFVIAFYVLRASRLEEAFKQGRVAEIRVAYVLISLISAFIMCELVDKLLSFADLNL